MKTAWLHLLAVLFSSHRLMLTLIEPCNYRICIIHSITHNNKSHCMCVPSSVCDSCRNSSYRAYGLNLTAAAALGKLEGRDGNKDSSLGMVPTKDYQRSYHDQSRSCSLLTIYGNRV